MELPLNFALSQLLNYFINETKITYKGTLIATVSMATLLDLLRISGNGDGFETKNQAVSPFE